METAHRTLLPAGLAAGAALALGATGLTILLIAAVAPQAQNAAVASRVPWMMWIGPTIVIAIGTWAIAQVVLRRPLWMRERDARRHPTTNSFIAVVVGLVVVTTLLSTRAALMSVEAMRGDGQAITESSSFPMLGMGLGGAGLPFVVLSSVLMLRWWQEQPGSEMRVI